jgi:L-2-hydroxyglutarate oxidase LhgO
MRALWGELEDCGGRIAFATPVERMSLAAGEWRVEFGGRDAGTADFDAIVNSAGLGAQALARRIEGYPADKIPPLVLAKGNYFAFAGKPVFSRLIYPTPVDGGLGVHVTLDLAGRMRFGPDVEWIDHESYTVDPHRADAFYDRIRRYWPGLPEGSLVPDYCGIRPKLTGPGQPAADFLIAGEAAHGMKRLVCLFGIESPGLTASLSLAQEAIDALVA